MRAGGISKSLGLPPTESRLMHSAGIQAMGLLMDRIVSRYPKDDQLKNNIKTSLRAIEKNVAGQVGSGRS